MNIPYLGSRFFILLFLGLLSDLIAVQSQSSDASVMQDLKKRLNSPSSLEWSDPDPCQWKKEVGCSNDQRVIRIQIGHKGLSGTLPPSLSKLSELQRFEVMGNQLSGPLPSLGGLSKLQYLLLNNNNFTSIPPGFFTGLSALQEVYLDYNSFSPWQIPENLRDAANLQVFSATQASIVGRIPDFLGTFAGLNTLHLAFNSLEGELPASFAGSQIQSLWLNGQKSNSKLNGPISVIQNMTMLAEVWLQSNSFSGPLPDFSQLTGLQNFSVRDNSITGLVPDSFVKLTSLKVVNLTNNLLQGPTPKFGSSVAVDMIPGKNRFCRSEPGLPCDSRVNLLLKIAESVGYPSRFAESWTGNDPCAVNWLGITCSSDGSNIIVVNFQRLNLTGTISPSFASITSLQTINLANNNLSGTIPDELTNLPNLKTLDLSNNHIHGKVPSFKTNVRVILDGNPDSGKDTVTPPPGTPSSPSGGKPSSDGTNNNTESKGKKSTGVVVGSVIGGVCAAFAVVIGAFCVYKAKRKSTARVQSPNAMVVHPRHSGSSQDAVKITISNSGNNNGTTETYSHGSSNGHSDLHVIESGSMVISIQVLKSVTNNFGAENILGRGGFGTVYKGELHDGTKIAVKRMESGVITEKGLDEFMSEIAVLTKVRHRHLVALLGYCLDGNERLLVYEYMPQGTLSRFLFDWKIEGLKPLEWSKRLTIALDVARAVEYLHGLAHQSFIHRDLKPSNILLGDDMRAKVADFGLVRLAPDGKASLVTRLAGTFGYLAPEYAVTGRVTTKVDVFSFGVILMELITGRKALYDTDQEESVHLVTWFRKISVDKETFRKAIDPTIELNEETLSSVSTVAELAGHCTAREPSQRPDMGHVVNVLSSLTELWKPSKPDAEDMYGIDFDMSLPQALKKWQALEGMSGVEDSTGGSSFLTSGDNTQTSIPIRPSGFADSFTSADGR